jgi:hypothetical protein
MKELITGLFGTIMMTGCLIGTGAMLLLVLSL